MKALLFDLFVGSISMILAYLFGTYFHAAGAETIVIIAPAFFIGMLCAAMPNPFNGKGRW